MRPRKTVDTRTLNRALLHRQSLLARRRLSVASAVERLVALQAQEPRDPYVALWSRLEHFRAERLSDALERRRAVRMTLLRGTLHLVTSRDAIDLRPLVQPAIEATVRGSSPLRRAEGDVDRRELLGAIRAWLEERPRTRADLVRAIAERWPGVDADSLGYAMYLLPTVQVTPRGLWRRSGRAAFTTLDAWLGSSTAGTSSVDELVLRYLAVFGPATPADAQSWSGIRGMRQVFERLTPRLRPVRHEDGRILFDVPRAPMPDPDVEAPVRFLPEYDNALLGYRDRDRVVSPEIPPWTEVGWGTVLVDGMGSARWRLREQDARPMLRIEPFRRMSRPERAAVTEEAERLVAFLEPEAERHDVSIAAP